ncbi:MAG TPA: hypothetical protein VMW51_11975 [Terriglobia bacterium]|nr:hypothetical protein [Terriglobia bacterium]
MTGHAGFSTTCWGFPVQITLILTQACSDCLFQVLVVKPTAFTAFRDVARGLALPGIAGNALGKGREGKDSGELLPEARLTHQSKNGYDGPANRNHSWSCHELQ